MSPCIKTLQLHVIRIVNSTLTHNLAVMQFLQYVKEETIPYPIM